MTILISYRCDDCGITFDGRDAVVEIPAKKGSEKFESSRHTERHACKGCATEWLWDHGNEIMILLNPDGSVHDIDIPEWIDGDDVPVEYLIEEIA